MREKLSDWAEAHRKELAGLSRLELAARAEAISAGSRWASKAHFGLLVTMATENIDNTPPDALRDMLWALTDPHCLAGDAWAEIHLGTADPSPAWLRFFWTGAMADFRRTFETGRAVDQAAHAL